MSELKTLKDFELKKIKEVREDLINSNNELLKNIKAEAIKWVKKKLEENPETWFLECEMMIEFHNITEEDLKDE